MDHTLLELLRSQQEALRAENERMREFLRMAGVEPWATCDDSVPAVTPSSMPKVAQIKTKMCKFNILGECTRGSNCSFAHSKEELNPLPDLRCTKMCKTLLNTGKCDAINCNYAHREEDLRNASRRQNKYQYGRSRVPGLVKEEIHNAPKDTPAYVVPTSLQPAGWQVPTDVKHKSISIDQSEGTLRIVGEELCAHSNDFNYLRTVRTSQTTVCSLTDVV